MMMFLSNRAYFDEKFTDFDVGGETFENLVFENCTFIHGSFADCILKNCQFNNCHFKECNLSLTSIEKSSFSRNIFEASQLIGLNWTLANWSKRSLLKPFDFHRCILNYSIFMGIDLKDVEMIGCLAKEVDFSDSSLIRANCNGTDFTNSRFIHTNLTEADFSSAQNYMIDATLNVLKKTKFSLPEAMSLLHSLDIILVD
jgi:fluoroquinolone resistance protein